MKNYQAASEPIWPYIGVVSCLFALSVVAARSWQEAPMTHLVGAPQPTVGRLTETPDFRSDLWLEPTVGFATRSPSRPTLRTRDLSSPVAIESSAASDWSAIEGLLEVDERLVETSTPEWPPAAQPQQNEVAQPAVELPVIEQPATSATAAFAGPVAEQVELQRGTPALAEAQPATAATSETNASPDPGAEHPVAERHSAEPRIARRTAVTRADSAESSPSTPVDRSRERSVVVPVSDDLQPLALTELVETLRTNAHTASWARRAGRALDKLRSQDAFASSEAGRVLRALTALAKEAKQLAASATSPKNRSNLLRADYAIRRRLAVWDKVHRVMANPDNRWITVGAHDLDETLHRVARKLGNSDVGRGWRSYLRLSELRAANQSGDSIMQRRLARRVLERLQANDRLTQKQRAYLAKAPFKELVEGLGRWSREPIDYWRLLDILETYEARRNAAASAELARVFQVARWSQNRDVAELADTLNMHYRNANLRVAVSADLINKLLPQPNASEEDVQEQILGAQVYGTSETNSRIRVVLVPDNQQWRLRLVARGNVNSSTAASKGPATFYNDSYSEFTAAKRIVVDSTGVKVGLAEADAESASALTGFHTQYDSLPVVGLLARAIAKQQHDDRYYDAQAATAAQLEWRARQRLDDEVHVRLEEIEDDFQEKILEPLNALQLRPKALDMKTTEERLVIRYRLAGNNQLGGHTARPQAPGDSLLSVQLHETALNNVVEKLELESSEESIQSLYGRISKNFRHSNLAVPDDLPQGVTIRFADQEALRLRLDEGRVVLTARIAELRSPRRTWRNFAVRAYYAPNPNQLEANLVRDGIIELAGRRLRLSDQIALRGIFSKVFSKNTAVNIINNRLARHPQMKELQVTQFVINDGWIGVALGPKRRAALAQERRRQLR